MQTFSDWELIAVNDGSRDDSYDLLKAWAETDRRIRVIRLPENSGLNAARNAALRTATGQMVAYLDHDDEYFPNFLQLVVRRRTRATCWFSATILSTTRQRERTRNGWKAGTRARRGDLFVENPVVPLGIAHRRTLVEKVGPFNEMLWREEDWDYWKRLAAGAEFVFLPLKSGRYHVRAESLSRVPHLTARQRETAVANWVAGRPIFGDGISELRKRPAAVNWNRRIKRRRTGAVSVRRRAAFPPGFPQALTLTLSRRARGIFALTPALSRRARGIFALTPALSRRARGIFALTLTLSRRARGIFALTLTLSRRARGRIVLITRSVMSTERKVAFVSPYCILDWASPAASATRDGLRLLASQGFECQAFCGAWFNVPEELLVAEALAKLGLRHEVRKAKIGGREGRLLFLVDGGVGVTLFENASTRGWLSGEEAETFLAACEISCARTVRTWCGPTATIRRRRPFG